MEFRPDRFSETGPEWVKLGNSEKRAVGKLIKGIEGKHSNVIGKKVTNAYRSLGLEVNSSNFLIKGSIGGLVVKLVDRNQCSNFKSQIDLYNHIKQMSLPAPCFLGSSIGDFSSGVPYIVMEYIDGHYFSGSKRDLELTAPAIKRLHDGFANYEMSGFPKVEVLQNNSKKILMDFLLTKKEWRSKLGLELDLLLQNNMDLILETEVKCSANLVKLLEIEQSIFNIDLHPHNIIVGTECANVIDIDSLKVSRWPTALGFCFYKVMRQVAVNRGIENVKYVEMLDFFKAISGHVDITNSRWDLLFFGALTEVLRRLLIIFEGNLGNQVSPWNRVMSIQINSIQEIQFLAAKVSRK